MKKVVQDKLPYRRNLIAGLVRSRNFRVDRQAQVGCLLACDHMSPFVRVEGRMQHRSCECHKVFGDTARWAKGFWRSKTRGACEVFMQIFDDRASATQRIPIQSGAGAQPIPNGICDAGAA